MVFLNSLLLVGILLVIWVIFLVSFQYLASFFDPIRFYWLQLTMFLMISSISLVSTRFVVFIILFFNFQCFPSLIHSCFNLLSCSYFSFLDINLLRSFSMSMKGFNGSVARNHNFSEKDETTWEDLDPLFDNLRV